MSGRLDGKIAVVTGSSRGIGRGTAIALGELGATVYVTGRTTGDGPLTIDTTVSTAVSAAVASVAVTASAIGSAPSRTRTSISPAAAAARMPAVSRPAAAGT